MTTYPPYGVQYLDPKTHLWSIRRFSRLQDARLFAARMAVKTHMGLEVHRANPDGSTDRLGREGWSPVA